MPFLIEHISEAVLALNILVLLAAGGLMAAAFLRRRRRESYFRRIDALREQVAPIVARILEGKVEYGTGLEALKAVAGNNSLSLLEVILLEEKSPFARTAILRRLCKDLGLVEIWQRQLGGFMAAIPRNANETLSNGLRGNGGRLDYLVRASSAHNLGVILHQPSWPLLVKALGDAHPDVATVAARSLGAIAEPQSFQPLLDCLHDVIQNNRKQVSLRSVKMALVGFPLQSAPNLLPSLQHSHRRIRSLAVDIIREMTEREAGENQNFVLDPRTFIPELGELFLNRLMSDENPDVRARAAPVIAYLNDPRAASALLLLLGDREWFVRLHAARALAKQRYAPRAHLFVSRLSDSHWMVREAATRTLFSFGHEGISQLLDHTLTTTDRYSKEQIADEIQRAGLIPTLLAQYAHNGYGKETRVIEQLADMGKTSCILESIEGSSERDLRRKFLSDFGRHPDPQIRSWVNGLASGKPFSKLRHPAATPGASAPRTGGL